MQSPPPYPFLRHPDAWATLGFHELHIQATVSETEDERLHQFLLYAQPRARGWTISGGYCSDPNVSGRFHLINLRVEFDYYSRNNITDEGAKMRVEYVVPTNYQGTTSLTGDEGPGFYWLDCPSVSAFCPTMAEALQAIHAITPYIPATLRHRAALIQRFALQQYVQGCLRLSGGSDPIREAALRRKLCI
jgi:hypothetical protein